MAFLVLLALAAVLLGCATGEVSREPENITVTKNWMDAELNDLRTGSTFRVRDFAGKRVLVESFTVQSSASLSQQQEIEKLDKEIGNASVYISLDTDPSEDEALVQDYIQDHSFSWYFAISAPAVTQELVDEFGVAVVDTVNAPIILVCEDQSTRFLSWGIKPVGRLKTELLRGCGVGGRVNGEPEKEQIVTPKSREEAVPTEPTPISTREKAAEEKLQEALDELLYGPTGRVLRDFSDLELVYINYYGETRMPQELLPLRYYYSPDANATFTVAANNQTASICMGKLDWKITNKDVSSGRCTVNKEYREALTGSPPAAVTGSAVQETERGYFSLRRWLMQLLGIEYVE